MGAFWTSWALWEKLCFVMGVSIVLVFIAGMLKVAHNHWKLRKYTALAKTKAAQRENGLESAPSPTRRKKGNDIPFGVRAIESGIEVDGVWISRSNTPANSTPGSPFLSATKETPAQPAQPSDRASTASNMSRLEIPQPAHGHARSSPARSYNSGHSRVSGNPFDRSLSSDRSPSRISTYIDHTAHGAHRSTYQPRRASHLRYSNSHTTDNAEALASLEGRHLASKTGSKSSQGKTTSTGSLKSAEYEIPGQRASDDSWSGSSGDSHRAYNGRSQGNKLPSHGLPQPGAVKRPNARYRSSDLDSLASHRESHAAETGQLFPRLRVNDTAGEWRAVQEPAEHRNFLSEGSVSTMGTRNDPFTTPQPTPLITPMEEPSRGPPSFEEFVRSTSPQGRYYLGEEGSIPLQHHAGNHQSGHGFGAGPVQQHNYYQPGKPDGSGRKASSFSEAV
ncbi:MAG: hypothetical protein L6R40_001111 [Gallowayella cf. fulva]|nr:MAG: hypothetical protein L6R40_001111 [Xanthomendoza cf. fulva]